MWPSSRENKENQYADQWLQIKMSSVLDHVTQKEKKPIT